jgi:hypothetical protein
MSSRAFKYILFTFFLTGMNFVYIALAQENVSPGVIVRPELKYKSGQLRDPFQSYLQKEETKPSVQGQGVSNLVQPKINLDTLVVQGIIWGGKIPQAIINNKVLAVGDLIEGAKILSIDKGGIALDLSGEIINLSAPGKNTISEKENNTPRV